MKKVLNVVEVEDEGLIGLLNERITVFCINYFYTGILAGVNKEDILLTDAYIIYETGSWSEAQWKDAQKLPNDIYVRISAIESYGIMKK